MSVFATTHPFLFFDYFRVPYEVRAAGAAALHALEVHACLGAVAPVPGEGAPAGAGGTPSRLLWLRADAGDPPVAAVAGSRPGRWTLGAVTLVGRLLPGTRPPSFLSPLGRDWRPAEEIRDASGRPVASVWRDADGSVFLPFDPGEVMQTLWSERYTRLPGSAVPAAARAALLRGYYLTRPAIPRSAQLALRRRFTRVQVRTAFPRWPVEHSLHDLYAWLFRTLAGVAGGPVPWVGFWPGDRSWALVLTHDVETDAGCRDLELLRGPERDLGYRSSWNFVPERYPVDEGLLAGLRAQGCEVGVHGLRHDGRDLGSRRLLQERLPRMRAAADRWGAVGFRSPATQRVWDWMPSLGFAYDSSYTDTDPYEPQPGGCCTYLPFLNRDLVELPITLPQDHTVFAILDHPDGEVWLHKARAIRRRGGMVLALTHPDYARDPRLARAWRDLLEEFRDDDTMWHALPREAAQWWRRRNASVVTRAAGGWSVRGPAAGEARVRQATPEASGLGEAA